MDRVNNRNDIEEMVVGSMDVMTLYPSLLATQSAKIITKVFLKTHLVIEEVNWLETGKYLAINLIRDEIVNLNLQEVVSSRAKNGGTFSGMTTAEVMGKLYRENKEEEKSLFNPPKKTPTEQEKKVMLAQVIKVALLAVLRNHTY